MAISKIVYHPISIIALTIVAIIFFLQLDKSGKKTQNSAENIRVLEGEVGTISGEIINLEDNINQADSQEFKEKVVRNELLLQKPGEYVLIIPEIEESEAQADCISKDCGGSFEGEGQSPVSAWMELIF